MEKSNEPSPKDQLEKLIRYILNLVLVTDAPMETGCMTLAELVLLGLKKQWINFSTVKPKITGEEEDKAKACDAVMMLPSVQSRLEAALKEFPWLIGANCEDSSNSGQEGREEMMREMLTDLDSKMDSIKS